MGVVDDTPLRFRVHPLKKLNLETPHSSASICYLNISELQEFKTGIKYLVVSVFILRKKNHDE